MSWVSLLCRVHVGALSEDRGFVDEIEAGGTGDLQRTRGGG